MCAQKSTNELQRFGSRPEQPGGRRGFTLVWCAILMVLMVGMTGLVLDSGLLWGTHRQTQNAADAAALAVAMDMLRNIQTPSRQSRANTFVQTHNGLSNATVTVNAPPVTGSYAGRSTFVEVVVSTPVQTAFIQVLGVNKSRTVTARAVAGYEAVSAGEGVAVLDPNARPGLDVSGGGVLRVQGRIIVNSEGGGVDEYGNPVNNGNNGFAAKGGQPNSETGIFATQIDVVGGVDNPASFKNIDPNEPSPLATKQVPEVDPLINLPTPTTANGLSSFGKGDANNASEISVTNQGHSADATRSPNYVDSSTGEVVLYPGSYKSISISGGKVKFMPGIYVIKWKSQGGGDALKITGGSVTANGVMFYNTGHNFNEDTGTPDSNDGETPPPSGQIEDGANFGSFAINAGITMSPIDTSKHSYSNSAISTFNGMLFYQRRRNTQGIDIQGESSAGVLSGTMYAKWARFKLSGQGTYSAQFIIGSLAIPGQGNITLTYAGSNLGKANQIFLVE